MTPLEDMEKAEKLREQLAEHKSAAKTWCDTAQAQTKVIVRLKDELSDLRKMLPEEVAVEELFEKFMKQGNSEYYGLIYAAILNNLSEDFPAGLKIIERTPRE